MNLIFLIGMPFAGKTYWARQLSSGYNIPYVDMDITIKTENGKSVAQIFETEGETAFRKKEQKLLQQIISTYRRPLIVSCGGGTPAFFDNLDAMKTEGCVVYLKASIETLTSRFENVEERNERPLLASVTDIEKELEDLLEKRKNIYEQAHYILNCEQLSISKFDQIISTCINRH